MDGDIPLSRADQHEIVDLFWKGQIEQLEPAEGMHPYYASSVLFRLWRSDKDLIDSHFGMKEED